MEASRTLRNASASTDPWTTSLSDLCASADPGTLSLGDVSASIDPPAPPDLLASTSADLVPASPALASTSIDPRAALLSLPIASTDPPSASLVLHVTALVASSPNRLAPRASGEEATREAYAMAKIGKQIQNRLDVSGKVVASARTHRKEIAEALGAQAEAVQGKNTKATAEVYAITLDAQADALEHAAAELKSAELAYSAEQADDVVPRDRRDKLTNELVLLMTRLRSTVEDALGPSGLSTYGLEGATPRAAKALASHVSNVVALMKKKPATVTTELGSTFGTAATVNALKPKGAALDAVIKELDREARELEAALAKRDQAIEVWTEVYQGVATALGGLYRLAGRKDLADRVRPTSRTVAGEDDASEDAPGGEASNEGVSEEEALADG